MNYKAWIKCIFLSVLIMLFCTGCVLRQDTATAEALPDGEGEVEWEEGELDGGELMPVWTEAEPGEEGCAATTVNTGSFSGEDKTYGMKHKVFIFPMYKTESGEKPESKGKKLNYEVWQHMQGWFSEPDTLLYARGAAEPCMGRLKVIAQMVELNGKTESTRPIRFSAQETVGDGFMISLTDSRTGEDVLTLDARRRKEPPVGHTQGLLDSHTGEYWADVQSNQKLQKDRIFFIKDNQLVFSTEKCHFSGNILPVQHGRYFRVSGAYQCQDGSRPMLSGILLSSDPLVMRLFMRSADSRQLYYSELIKK